MQDEFLVHTREGQDCLRCGGEIRRIVVAGRSTYFCPDCQVPVAPPPAPEGRGTAVSRPAAPAGFSNRALERSRGEGRLHRRDRARRRAGWGGRAGRWSRDARDGRDRTAGRHRPGDGRDAGRGSAFGLSAADGAMRWLEEQGNRAIRRRRGWSRSCPRRSSTTWRRAIPTLAPAPRPDMRLRRGPGGPARPGRVERAAGRPRASCSAGNRRFPGRGVRGGDGRRRGDRGGAGRGEPVRRRARRRRGAAGAGTRRRRHAHGRRDRGDGGAARPVQGAAGQYDPSLRDDRRAARQVGLRGVARSAAGIGRAVEPVFTDVDGDVVSAWLRDRPGRPTGSRSSKCRRSPPGWWRGRSATPLRPPRRGRLTNRARFVQD